MDTATGQLIVFGTLEEDTGPILMTYQEVIYTRPAGIGKFLQKGVQVKSQLSSEILSFGSIYTYLIFGTAGTAAETG